MDETPVGRAGAAAAVWLLVLMAAAIGLYGNALDNPFVLDDPLIIAGNPTVAKPSLAGLAKLWTADYWQGIDEQGRVAPITYDRNLYRPITVVSFWLNAAISGAARPFSFRLVNVLLHALAAWLVGIWVMRWTGRAGGVVASAVILLHPIATDVVNRIVGRADILALAGIAGLLVTQQSAARRDGWTPRRTALAAMWAAVALGAKESGLAVLPLAAVQRWVLAPPPERAAHGWRGGAALAIVLGVYLAGRLSTVGWPHYARSISDLTGNPLAGVPWASRLPATAALAWRYLAIMVYPSPLLAFESPQRLPTWTDPTAVSGAIALTLVLAAAWTLGMRRHALALAASWWLACFLVVGQLLTPIGAYTEVRLAYPMLAALGLLVGWLAARSWWRAVVLRAGGIALLTVVAVLACLVVRSRNRDFASEVALVEADLRQRPDGAAALVRVGGLYESAGRLAEAERAFTRAVEVAPQSAQARYELGLFYEQRGRRDLARRSYEEAIARNPEHAFALLNLGAAALDAGDLDRAEGMLRAAERSAPDNEFVAYNLAVLEERQGKRAQAIRRLEDLTAKHPEYRQAADALALLKEPGASASEVRP